MLCSFNMEFHCIGVVCENYGQFMVVFAFAKRFGIINQNSLILDLQRGWIDYQSPPQVQSTWPYSSVDPNHTPQSATDNS